MLLVKVTLLCAALAAALLLVVLTPAHAQDPTPEASPFVTACDYALALAAQEGYQGSNCRRVDESVVGNVAIVSVSVKIQFLGRYIVRVNLFRSQWSIHGVFVRPV